MVATCPRTRMEYSIPVRGTGLAEVLPSTDYPDPEHNFGGRVTRGDYRYELIDPPLRSLPHVPYSKYGVAQSLMLVHTPVLEPISPRPHRSRPRSGDR